MALPLTNTQILTLGIVLFASGLGAVLSALLLTTTTLREMLEGSSVSFATDIVLAGCGIISLYSGWRIISELLDEDGSSLNENELREPNETKESNIE